MPSESTHAEYREVEISLVEADSNQPRKTFDQSEIDALAETIRKRGLLNPIRVRRHPERQGRFIIIGGERRWRAAIQAGQQIISCLIINGDLSPSDVLEEQLLDNMHRADLNPIDQAHGFKQLADMRGWNPRQLAHHLSLVPKTMFATLSLLNLADDVQALVSSGRLGKSAAYEVAKISGPAQQWQIAQQVIDQNLPASRVAALVRRATRQSRPKRGPTRVQINLSCGTRVVVVSRRKLDEAGVLEVLVRALQDVQEDIVTSTAGEEAQRELITAAVLEELIRAFDSKDLSPNFQAAVDEAIARIGPAVVLELYRLLSHEERTVREETIPVLNGLSMEVKRAIAPLRTRGRAGSQ